MFDSISVLTHILANPTASRGNLPISSLIYRLLHFKAYLPLVAKTKPKSEEKKKRKKFNL